MLLSEEEENEIREFISLITPIQLVTDHEMNAINWGLDKIEAFTHRFAIPDPYRTNLLNEVHRLREYPFWVTEVTYSFYLLADILEDFLKYVKRIEIKSSEQSLNMMTYLLESFKTPQAIEREEGDSQIQQMAQFILGHIQRNPERRLRVMDIGAGKGGLIDAIKISGTSSLISYIPIEINQDNWTLISERCRECEGLEFQAPKAEINESEIDHVDLVFFINVFHELSDIDTRVKNLYNAFKLTQKKGQVIIHEVVILPKLEADFFLWDVDDYKKILNDLADIEIVCANTLTRAGGLPLQTICLFYNDINLISEEIIRSSIESSLIQIMDKWFELFLQENENDNSSNKRKRYIAFLMAQHTYAKVLCHKYVQTNDTNGDSD